MVQVHARRVGAGTWLPTTIASSHRQNPERHLQLLRHIWHPPTCLQLSFHHWINTAPKTLLTLITNTLSIHESHHGSLFNNLYKNPKTGLAQESRYACLPGTEVLFLFVQNKRVSWDACSTCVNFYLNSFTCKRWRAIGGRRVEPKLNKLGLLSCREHFRECPFTDFISLSLTFLGPFLEDG